MPTTRRLVNSSERRPTRSCRISPSSVRSVCEAPGVIAKEDYDTAQSNKSTAAGDVIAAQAAVNAAKLNLEFTHVISPIDGRVSRQLVNIGNLVQADSTRLTTVVSIDPIYAYFSMDELAALKFQRLMRDGKLVSGREGKVLVYLQLQDETQFPHQGTIDFSDNAYDTSTGTLLIRGTFVNRDGLLAPGNFVRMRVPSSLKYNSAPGRGPGNRLRPRSELCLRNRQEQYRSPAVTLKRVH